MESGRELNRFKIFCQNQIYVATSILNEIVFGQKQTKYILWYILIFINLNVTVEDSGRGGWKWQLDCFTGKRRACWNFFSFCVCASGSVISRVWWTWEECLSTSLHLKTMQTYTQPDQSKQDSAHLSLLVIVLFPLVDPAAQMFSQLPHEKV